MGRLSALRATVFSSFAALAACGTPDSLTELNPEGPPMVRQVFVSERFVVDGGSDSIRVGLAFGSHSSPELAEDDGEVVAAVARGGGQQIRIILDELVGGYALEEVACDAILDAVCDGEAQSVYSTVPAEADPDDMERCSGEPAELGGCEGICIGADGPIGILDVDLDGAPDDTRMIDFGRSPDVPCGTGELAVNVECDGQNMPLDPDASFFNPSGNQQLPVGPLGLNGLGPSIVLVPAIGLKTSAACTVTFRDEVVDKDGNRVCASPGGSIDEDCPGDGDTSLISFTIEGLKVAGSDPADGNMAVAPNVPSTLVLVQFNAALDPASVAGITLNDGVADVPVTPTPSADDPTVVTFEVAAGFAPETTYTITIPTSVTDFFGGPMPAAETLTFTTTAAI